MSRSPTRRRSGEIAPAVDKVNPTETRSITFEWPLHDLKEHFDSSKSDTKSKVIRSVPFGGGRWTVFFYAQSGLQQFCSLYLNAEPLPEERNCNKSPWETFLSSNSPDRSHTSHSDKAVASRNDGWSRQGLFRFTFKILTLNTGAVLATKEACDHAFSHKTSNWGWAQFSSRDTVFYNNAEVQQSNAFLISVTITANAERPRPLTVGVSVPPALVEAMGSLLDDPDHSDVVFVIRRKRRHPATGVIVTRERRIYAIKKILASRCEYFRDMFDSGFLEADATASSSDDEMPDHPSFAPPSSRGPGQDQLGRSVGALASFSDEDEDDLALEDSDEELDADEVYEMGTWNLHEDGRRDDILMARQATALPPASSTDSSASRHQRETSSDVPQVWPTSAVTVVPTPSGPPRKQPSQQNTPPQSRSRQIHDQDAGTDSGEDAARASGMSAFQTPQHSPRRELRNDGATDLSQLRDALPARAKPAAQPASRVPQRRKSDESTGASAPTGKKRRKVVVRDAAYATYKALLYYLYTDTVAFAPLHSHFYAQSAASTEDVDVPDDTFDSLGAPLNKPDRASSASDACASSESGDVSSHAPSAATGSSFAKDRRRAHVLRQQVIDEYCSTHIHVPAPCSAKSMYRLADKLQIPELKDRAQKELAKNLSVDNIVWEAFSGFNSQFPAIRKMETDFLLKHWSEVKGTEVMKSIFARPTAHPGLADVWPHLLSQLEFRGGSSGSKNDDKSAHT